MRKALVLVLLLSSCTKESHTYNPTKYDFETLEQTEWMMFQFKMCYENGRATKSECLSEALKMHCKCSGPGCNG